MAGKYKVQIKNNDGTMSDLPIVATYDSSGNNIAATYAKKTEGIYYIEGTGTTAGTWTGSHADITEYYDGLTIAYRTNIEGASTTKLNINNLGAATCYLRGTTKVTTHYAVNTVIIFTYITVSGTGRWVTNDYDNNTDVYVRQYFETANSELPLIMSHTEATSGGSTYKTTYGGVVAGVTLNPSTKTISATAFKENGTALSNKYVAQESGKGLSTNDYTTAEKTNLNKAVLTDNAQTISGAKTFTNTLTLTTGSSKYSIQADGYIKGSWLQATSTGNLSSASDKICVLDSSGWVYYRTKAQLKSDLGVPDAYTLPAATSSTLGGVKIGSNITNSSGTISLTSANVTGALGYTPASSTDLENKADVYKTTAGGGLRGIQVGDDLSGKTVYFDTTKTANDMTSYPSVTISGTTSYESTSLVGSSMSPPELYVDHITVYDYENGWSYTSLTLPNTVGTITSITGGADQFILIQEGGETVTVDCEYNYNEIQALKAEIETLKAVIDDLSNPTYSLSIAGTLENFKQTYGPAYGPTICGVIKDVNGGTNTGFILYSTTGSCDLYYSADLANKTLTIQVYAYGGQFTATVENSGIPTTVKGITWDLDAFVSEYFTNITLDDLNAAFALTKV